jgi:ADP-ribosyl-[dinitrogen reductase] hydrolase
MVNCSIILKDPAYVTELFTVYVALGAGYEFGEPFEDDPNTSVDMIGGGLGPFDPYEWTDDTSLAIALAEALVSFRSSISADNERHSLTIPDSVLDKVVNRWYEWSETAKDIGLQTRQIMHTSKLISGTFGQTNRGIMAEDALKASKRYHEKIRDRSGGNGSLMRTAPLALSFLQLSRVPDDDEEVVIESALMEAAFRVSALTHWDRNAREACGIWCIAIRHAVLTGELDIRRALKRPKLFTNTYPITGEEVVDDVNERVQLWESRIVAAESSRPSAFTRNGWVVEAFQGAWSAIHHARAIMFTTSPISPQSHSKNSDLNTFRLALELAVRGGNDTDTVAAIAGGLVGAVYGADVGFIPQKWVDNLHGWPNIKADGLVKLVNGIVGAPDTA